MKNNIKKASVKFWEGLLYFQHFCRNFALPEISDYHHLKDTEYMTSRKCWRLRLLVNSMLLKC